MHLLAPGIVWVVVSIFGYVNWQKGLVEKAEGWGFDARVDKTGVTTWHDTESRHNWNFYLDYKEYDDYLEIRDQDGNVTFVPKEPHLAELIEFTKKQIPVH